MEVKKVIITNFKSIKGPVELDMERMRGFWKLGGAVGAGKTTIGEAIIFGLFGDVRGKNNTDLVTWGEKKGMIEIYATSKGHDICIKREFRLQGQASFYVEVDGSEITFTNKRDAQSQLEKDYYDVSKMTLELLCIISFNNFKSLATLNTADSKAFLDQVFGFYVLTNYGELCKEFMGDVEGNIRNTNSQISAIRAQIDKIQQLSNIEKIEGDISEINNQISHLDEEYASKKDEVNQLLINLRKEWTLLQTELGKIKLLGANKRKEIDFIKQGKCPTCGAPIDQSQLEIKEQERELLVQQYNTTNQKSNDKQKEIIEQESQLKIIDGKYKEDVTSLRELKTKLQEQEKRLSINTKEIDELNIKLNEQNNILSQQEKDEQEWRTLYNILSKDVRQKILSSFIPLLNQSISFYTKQLQLPYVIIFDDNFRCSVQLAGIQRDIPISSLSTGQLKTVDISIILGVLRTIMNNVNFNINFLDELISNMDADLRETICKVLKSNIKPSQTIFIISHVEMDEKYFDGIIESQLNYNEEGLPYSTYNFSK